ncbi:MAG: Rnf-Nqr domain containing protein [Pseudomonadota bacterium]
MTLRLFIDNIIRNKLWQQHPLLLPLVLPLLGLLPLLAASDSVAKAFAVASATLLVVTATTLLTALCRHQLVSAIRLPALAVLISALAICAELLLQAWTFCLYASLGQLMPLPFILCMLLLQADLLVDRATPWVTWKSSLVLLPLLLLFGVLALPPPAIFLLLAGLMALRNAAKQRLLPPTPTTDTHPIVAGSKRVRVTGKI